MTGTRPGTRPGTPAGTPSGPLSGTLSGTPLSVLDLAPVGVDGSPEEALATTLDLARRADELGFTRFWVAEHHGMPGIASSTPEVTIAALAARTQRIRVGSGAVLLSHRATRPVAEAFGTLAALFPHRVDLGVGRGGGGAPGSFETQLDALADAVGTAGDAAVGAAGDAAVGAAGNGAGHAAGHADPLGEIVPRPAVPAHLWLVGSSAASAVVAAERGLPYVFAHHFFGPTDAVAALRAYRAHFRPTPANPVPHAVLTVHTVCGEDAAHARHLVGPALVPALGVGGLGPRDRYLTPDRAAALPWTAEQLAEAERIVARQAVGSPEAVAHRLRELVAATRADEVMVTTNLTAPADKRSTLDRLVAATAALDGAPLGTDGAARTAGSAGDIGTAGSIGDISTAGSAGDISTAGPVSTVGPAR